jgi:hypothetical protein
VGIEVFDFVMNRLEVTAQFDRFPVALKLLAGSLGFRIEPS